MLNALYVDFVQWEFSFTCKCRENDNETREVKKKIEGDTRLRMKGEEREQKSKKKATTNNEMEKEWWEWSSVGDVENRISWNESIEALTILHIRIVGIREERTRTVTTTHVPHSTARHSIVQHITSYMRWLSPAWKLIIVPEAWYNYIQDENGNGKMLHTYIHTYRYVVRGRKKPC